MGKIIGICSLLCIAGLAVGIFTVHKDIGIALFLVGILGLMFLH